MGVKMNSTEANTGVTLAASSLYKYKEWGEVHNLSVRCLRSPLESPPVSSHRVKREWSDSPPTPFSDRPVSSSSSCVEKVVQTVEAVRGKVLGHTPLNGAQNEIAKQRADFTLPVTLNF